MKISLFNIGRTESLCYRQSIGDYSRRLSRFIDFTVIDLPDIKNASSLTPDLIRKKEGEMLLKATAAGNYLILLDEKGKEFTSVGFSQWIENLLSQSYKQVCFVTGGAWGFSPEVYQAASFTLSLSKMTFTHQMVRLFFTEQLYRAFSIMKGLPYHND